MKQDYCIIGNTSYVIEECHCKCDHNPMKQCKTPETRIHMDLKYPFEELVPAKESETKKPYTVYYGYAFVCPNCQLRVKVGY